MCICFVWYVLCKCSAYYMLWTCYFILCLYSVTSYQFVSFLVHGSTETDFHILFHQRLIVIIFKTLNNLALVKELYKVSKLTISKVYDILSMYIFPLLLIWRFILTGIIILYHIYISVIKSIHNPTTDLFFIHRTRDPVTYALGPFTFHQWPWLKVMIHP